MKPMKLASEKLKIVKFFKQFTTKLRSAHRVENITKILFIFCVLQKRKASCVLLSQLMILIQFALNFILPRDDSGKRG